MKKREEGAALLAVLLLVALIATLAALAVDKLGMATHLAGNARAADQARGYAFGAEALVTLVVDDLTDRTSHRIPLPAGWREEIRTIPVDGGIIRTRIHDGGNCFNLNSLVEGNPLAGYKARQQGMQRFLSLLEIEGVAEARARPIVAAVTDWIDSDSDPLPGGIEDRTYAQLALPYRTGNTLMADPSELRAVAGMTPDLYARLRPWVCALPAAEPALINVNILQPEQAVLLAMLYGGRLGLPQAQAVLRARPPGGWTTLQQFQQMPQLNSLSTATAMFSDIDLRTRWFNLDLDVALDGAQVKERALIDAGVAPSRVVMRNWGGRVTMIPPDAPALLLFAEDDVGAIEGWFRVMDGRIVAGGGGLTTLPEISDAERVILVLRGPDVSIDWVELPPLTAPQAMAAARLALAERSPSAIDSLHVAIGEVHGGRRMTATIDADLLARWLAWAQEQGLDPDHVVPLPLLIAYGDGPARLWERQGIACVHGHDHVFAVEADLAPLILADMPTEAMDDARFEAELPAALVAVPIDLRQGRFVRRREWRIDAGWRQRMRRYALVAVILLLCIPVVRLGRIAYDAHAFDAESRRVARLALGRESLPDDPRAALQERLTDLRGPGMGFATGAGALFGAVAHTPNVELSGLVFDQSGTITANVTSANPADLADLVRRIGQSGLIVEMLPGATREGAVLQIRQP